MLKKFLRTSVLTLSFLIPPSSYAMKETEDESSLYRAAKLRHEHYKSHYDSDSRPEFLHQWQYIFWLKTIHYSYEELNCDLDIIARFQEKKQAEDRAKDK